MAQITNVHPQRWLMTKRNMKWNKSSIIDTMGARRCYSISFAGRVTQLLMIPGSLADQVFTDALVKAYHRKHPLKKRGAPSFATCLCAALAKSHWHPHSPDKFWSNWPHDQAGLYWGPKDLCPYSTHCVWYCEEHIHPHLPCCDPAHQNHCWSRCLREKHIKKVYSQGPS